MANPVERGTATPRRKTANSTAAEGVVSRIVGRLEGRGIPDILQHYDASVIGYPWGENPIGFKFTCNNRRGLIKDLSSNLGFAESPGWIERMFRDVEFREVSDNGSLHVVFPNNSREPCVVHLDSVSVVAGRDEKGKVIFKNADTIQRHLALDDKLKYLRFDVTERRLSTPLDGERGTIF